MEHKKTSSVILHIPHSSTLIPKEYLEQFCIDRDQLDFEMARLTDHFTDTLFSLSRAQRIVFPVSRMLIDPERFEDDEIEMMSKVGMGVIYTNGTQLTPIRESISPQQRTELINRYYRPHHAALDQVCSEALEAHQSCLVIDCHSFSCNELPYEVLNPNVNIRPEICIGTDDIHTSKEVGQLAYDLFVERGYETGFNNPFAGTLVPSKYYGKDDRVQSIMIEVRRDLYMDESSIQPTDNFNKVRADISEIIEEIEGWCFKWRQIMSSCYV